MKILYITRKFPPSVGGMQKHSYEFYNALKKKEDVYLIAWGHSQVFLPYFFITVFINACFINLKHKMDIIHLGDLVLLPLGWLLKVFLRKPLILTAYGLDVVYKNPFYQILFNKLIGTVDKILCISIATKNLLIKKNIPKEKLDCLPVGIDINAWLDSPIDKNQAKAFLEKRIPISLLDRKILVTIGRLITRKGVKQFLKFIFPNIISEKQNVRYLIVGEGPEEIDIRAEIKEQGLSNKALIFIKVEDELLKLIYQTADIFIMPNQHVEGDFEGFGIVALEASMNEVPVIAFDVDGISQAVKNDENGILIEEGDNEGFAKAVKQLLNDENKRINLGKKAKKFIIENYNWNTIINKYIKILKIV